jgi:hypothetical protein
MGPRLATILEVPSGVIPPQFLLADGAWGSVAMVSTVALTDEATGIYTAADHSLNVSRPATFWQSHESPVWQVPSPTLRG